MSLIRRLLGLPGDENGEHQPESEGVLEIAARLEELDPNEARQLATFAYVLARVANADLSVDGAERQEMERAVASLSGLAPERAKWVVEMACARSTNQGGTDDYLVTREFRARASREERVQLLECLFAVAASDGSISVAESETTLSIAEELGFSRQEGLGLRSRWRDHLAELQGGGS